MGKEKAGLVSAPAKKDTPDFTLATQPAPQFKPEADSVPVQRQEAQEEKKSSVQGPKTSELHKKALELTEQFAAANDNPQTQAKIGAELVQIYYMLDSRISSHTLGFSNAGSDDLATVFDLNDPLFGLMGISAANPYNNFSDWDAAAKNTAASWDPKDLHAAYSGNGKVRTDNSGTGDVESFREKVKTSNFKDDGNGNLSLKGTMDWTKEQGGTATYNPDLDISVSEMKQIVGPGLVYHASMYDQKHGKGSADQVIQSWIDEMKTAFRIAKIDTVEAQAAYIGHSAGEIVFSKLSEGQTNTLSSDPSEANYSKSEGGPVRYGPGKKYHDSVDPANALNGYANMDQDQFNHAVNDTFIGRGPVQVTHDWGYTRALIMMEEMAKTTEKKEDKILLWEAVKAIKEDPSQAANPKYSFLFSAAFMHISGGARQSARLATSNVDFYGQDAASSWVAGGGWNILEHYNANPTKANKGHVDSANRKSRAYSEVVKLLKAKLKAKP
ncbi:MAG: hypothetical protein H6581_13485 [Bacteroidia bacterium]|nr:hypothetical protein [Bacteroidia bacterium]